VGELGGDWGGAHGKRRLWGAAAQHLSPSSTQPQQPQTLQDVVEIPSHLWEHFVNDHRTLGLIARHSVSREPMPAALHSALLASHAAFPALELQQQVGGVI